jgi:two-component system response regulator EvgA
MSKPHVLIVDDEEEIRDILSFFVESTHPCEVSLASDGVEAIELLTQKKIDLIICDYNMPHKNGGEVYKHILESGLPCKYVMCSSETPQSFSEFQDGRSMFGYIQKPNLMNGIKEVFQRYKLSTDLVNNQTQSEIQSYYPISTRLLVSLNNMPVNIFLKLSDGKYVKVFSEGSVFDETDFLKYEAKGILQLFALNFSTDILVQKVQKIIENISKGVGKNNKAQAVVEIQDLVLSTLKDYGFHDGLSSVVEAQISDTIKLCEHDRTLEMLLNKMLKIKGSYISRHSFMLAAVTVALANKVGWNSETTSQKLVMSSLFHDVFLKENVLNEVSYIESKNMDDDFMNHPFKAAQLLDKIPKVPPDTGRIVLEQHEVGEDGGFPRAIAVSETTPLGQLFTFSHYLVDAIFELSANNEFSKSALEQKMQKVASRSSRYKKFLVLLNELKLY